MVGKALQQLGVLSRQIVCKALQASGELLQPGRCRGSCRFLLELLLVTAAVAHGQDELRHGVAVPAYRRLQHLKDCGAVHHKLAELWIPAWLGSTTEQVRGMASLSGRPLQQSLQM